MIMNTLGTLVLQITFGLALIALILIVFMRKTDTKKHPGVLLGLVACSGVLVSSVLLMVSMVNGIFSVEYAYHNTESSLPLIYKISAFWSGSAGSMLLWTAFFALLLIFIYAKRRDEEETKTVFGVVLVFIIIFMVMIGFINNPFKEVTPTTDGFGLNPALQTVGMVFHPPIVILGFAFFFIALAYSFHDLRDKGQPHKDSIRKWTLWGWVLLTGGIISGGLWAYTELGWGGYWAWDPIENSSLVNWLLATAFLHTLSGGDKNKKKNFILIALTVFSVLIGTFIARSGILKSVHAYSSQSILTFLGISLILLAVITVLLYLRSREKNPVDREGYDAGGVIKPGWFKKALQPVNLLPTILMVMAALIFGGTIFPLVGKETPMDFYNYTFSSLGLVLLLVIGICPILFSGKKSSLIPGAVAGLILFVMTLFAPEYDLLTKISLAVCTMLIISLLLRIVLNFKSVFTDRKQLSFVVLHVSIVLIALGITGSKGITYGMEQMFEYGAVKSVKGYTVRYKNLQWRTSEKGKTVAIATLKVQGPKTRTTLKPELTYYHKRDMNHSRAVIKAGLWEDLYIIFEGLDEQNRALFKVMVLRWVSLVWIGGILLIVGTLLRFGFKTKTTWKEE
jgi:cytochrome c-type biogenesis protein CcmF